MDDEWEEEEQLVVVELSGIINNDAMFKSATCEILDIDSEQPMMQMGQYVFAGEYEDTLGTCVLFEEGPGKGKDGNAPELKYMCHTVKKLMMQRIFLSERKENESDAGSLSAGGQSDQQGSNTVLHPDEKIEQVEGDQSVG
ncbi:general transcription factor 3C polypeptide 6 [Stigmatopora argus]